MVGPELTQANKDTAVSPCLPTGTRKMEYKGSSWHETCFTCHRCQQPIGTKSFIPKDNQNFCVPCYEKQYALQCVQCKKVYIFSLGHAGSHQSDCTALVVSSRSERADTPVMLGWQGRWEGYSRPTLYVQHCCVSGFQALALWSVFPSLFQRHQHCDAPWSSCPLHGWEN